MGDSNSAQRTPNLAGLLQEIVSRPGWASGNAIAIIISGTGHRTAESFDKPGGNPARLSVTYSSPSTLYTVSSIVNSSANDAEQSASGPVNLTSTDLELVNDAATGAGDQIIGVRFENVFVPPGAMIASANIQFSTDEVQNEPTTLTLHAQAADNPLIFATAANNISARPLTGASVTWSPLPWDNLNERGPLQRTPDLSALVHEVVTPPGWSNGNAMAFIISGSGHRTAESFDKPGGLPASLSVSYWTEIPRGTYARWSSTHPNTSLLAADPDGDGYNNLMEYALGLNPSVTERGVTPLVVNVGSLELTYARPVSVTDVTYQVQWADNIDAFNWSGLGVTQQIFDDDGNRRLIRATIPKGATGHRFVRLKVIK
jgi:hypothetical protein